MSTLSEAEKAKIIEEERLRAQEQGKYQKKESKKISGCSGCLIIALVVVFIPLVLVVLGSARDKADKAQNSPSSSISPITEASFDVPALVGKTLPQIQLVLGRPAAAISVPPNYEGTDWEVTWEEGGKRLMVTYNLKTTKVIDFFIPTDDPSGNTQDKDRLLAIGNLKTNDTHYTVEFVKAIKDPSVYTGVKVIPK